MISRPSLDEVRDWRRHVDEARRRAPSRPCPPTALELVELGINHEQQHQELFLTDILATFAENPLEPAYAEAPPASCHAPEPLSFLPGRTGIVEIGAPRRRLRLRQRAAAAPGLAPPPRHRQPPGDQRRMARVHRRRRLCDAGPVAVRRLGLGARARHRRAALLARGRQPLHPRRPPRHRPGRAGRPHQLLTKPMRSPAGPGRGCRPRPNGRISPRRADPNLGNQLDSRRRGDAQAAAATSSAMSGNGRKALRALPRLRARRRHGRRI